MTSESGPDLQSSSAADISCNTSMQQQAAQHVSQCQQAFRCCWLCSYYATRFALAFGDSVGSVGIFGSPLQYGLMYNVGAAPNAALAGTIPLTVFFM
jgi:hypothetical protein